MFHSTGGAVDPPSLCILDAQLTKVQESEKLSLLFGLAGAVFFIVRHHLGQTMTV